MRSFENSEVIYKRDIEHVLKIALMRYLILFLRSRTEISSLGSAKKGWQKTAHGDKSSSALILTEELRMGRTSDKLNIDNSCPTTKPKTPMELDRDLRKLPTKLEKCRSVYFNIVPCFETVSFKDLHFLISSFLINRYLSRVGRKRVIKLLQADGNAELLQIIIEILLSVSEISVVDDTMAIKRGPISPAVNNDDSEMSNAIKNCIVDKAFSTVEALQWLDALTGLDKFNLMILFLSKDLIADIIRTLHTSVNMHYYDVADRYNSVK